MIFVVVRASLIFFRLRCQTESLLFSLKTFKQLKTYLFIIYFEDLYMDSPQNSGFYLHVIAILHQPEVMLAKFSIS